MTSWNKALKSLMTDLLAKQYTKGKFVLVGIWNTIFGYFVFYLLDTILPFFIPTRYVAYMSAMFLAQVIAVTNAYIFHKYITFNSKAKGKGILFEFLRFSMTYVVTLCLSLILLPLFVEIFHITPKISGAMIIPICTVVSYLGHSRFSFRPGQV